VNRIKNSNHADRNQFANRLSELCKTKASASAVARDLEINRQQFARYLNGESVPRQSIARKIADYFDVDPGALFSDKPIREQKSNENTLEETFRAVMALHNDARIQEITDTDLEPGIYWQYKTLLRQPEKVLKTLVSVTKTGNVYRYKRRSSVVYNELVNSTVKNTINGVFMKQNGHLLLIDVEERFADMTFHVFATSNHYDRSIKPGIHMTIGMENSSGPRAARIFLKRIPDGDSILAHARTQGVYRMADLSTADAHILEGEGSGLLHI